MAAFLAFLLLLLLSYGAGSIRCEATLNNTADLLSLMDFKKHITEDPTQAMSSWNASVPFCQWTGVSCSRRHPGRVTALNLFKLSLSGTISSSLGNLTFLKALNFSSNHFSGKLPPLNHLHRLKVLDLRHNSLRDTIPEGLANCSRLRVLDLSSNSLVGEIPTKLGLLTNLSSLCLSNNSFTGTIPPTLGNITGLNYLSLQINHLEGSIPRELGKLSDLLSLNIFMNNISGRLPHELFNLSSLQTLWLSDNMLGKEALPPNIGDVLPNLQFLSLARNMFEGHIPTSLINASGLWLIDLTNNNFYGQVPSYLSELANLSDLYLAGNHLEASDNEKWLHAFANCTLLQALNLARNQIKGDIPSSIGNLSTNLQYLNLGVNHFVGVVPPSIGNLHGLTSLWLSKNNLIGTIEEWVGKLRNLELLYLQENNFTGSIPSSIGNSLDGQIPANLGNLRQLDRLNFSYNNLHGSIPYNVGKLRNLVQLDLSHNNLDGNIPSSFIKLQKLKHLDLSDNNFQGIGLICTGKINNPRRGVSIAKAQHNVSYGCSRIVNVSPKS
uniref:non-specific serine/threonine protein kinase n=1 Tax=Oryza sativa subsp. japonica TaxID=39947 RepID=Q6K6X6_ORYSJ|nr:putative protein kinase Xa21 D, receptor type [Oryza sativa Japonica Group]BAD19603.1 putative protein kinase Xa21 D, receptor type [Oryza sativa Japonica Group]